MAKSENELREIIRNKCKADGREAVADELQVKPSYLSMMISPTSPRPIPIYVAQKLGFRLETSISKVFVEL